MKVKPMTTPAPAPVFSPACAHTYTNMRTHRQHESDFFHNVLPPTNSSHITPPPPRSSPTPRAPECLDRLEHLDALALLECLDHLEHLDAQDRHLECLGHPEHLDARALLECQPLDALALPECPDHLA